MMFQKIYYHKWFPRVFYKKYDGGRKSGVTGYMLIEWKKVFSIGLLHFDEGSREAFHTHAFNALTWWLKGSVTEVHYPSNQEKDFFPSLKPKLTRRSCFHKVLAHSSTWALTFRGPWEDIWYEHRPNDGLVSMTHDHKVVEILSDHV